MEIHRCGNSWVCCDGKCENCSATKITFSNRAGEMGADTEYIEREALMKFPIRRDHYDRKNGNEHFINGIESVLDYAENLPSADVAPVVHGRWEKASNLKPKCSVCGKYHLYAWADHKNCCYCPHCGARMDLEVMDNGKK